MINPELRDLKSEWVFLAGATLGMKHLHIAVTHGDNTVTELWLTRMQAEMVARVVITGIAEERKEAHRGSKSKDLGTTGGSEASAQKG